MIFSLRFPKLTCLAPERRHTHVVKASPRRVRPLQRGMYRKFQTTPYFSIDSKRNALYAQGMPAQELCRAVQYRYRLFFLTRGLPSPSKIPFLLEFLSRFRLRRSPDSKPVSLILLPAMGAYLETNHSPSLIPQTGSGQAVANKSLQLLENKLSLPTPALSPFETWTKRASSIK